MKKTLTVLLALVLVLALAMPAFASDFKDPPAGLDSRPGFNIAYDTIVETLEPYVGSREANEITTVLIGNPEYYPPAFSYVGGPKDIAPSTETEVYYFLRDNRSAIIGLYNQMIDSLKETDNQTEAWVVLKAYESYLEEVLEESPRIAGILNVDVDLDTPDLKYNAATGNFEGYFTVHVENTVRQIETTAKVYPIAFKSSFEPTPAPTTAPSAAPGEATPAPGTGTATTPAPQGGAGSNPLGTATGNGESIALIVLCGIGVAGILAVAYRKARME